MTIAVHAECAKTHIMDMLFHRHRRTEMAHTNRSGTISGSFDYSEWGTAFRDRNIVKHFCPGCGAELSPGVLRLTAVCPCCQAALPFAAVSTSGRPLTRGQVSSAQNGIIMLRNTSSDFILPFFYDRKDLAKTYARGQSTDPGILSDDLSRKITPENIRRVYLPFWLIDFEAAGDVFREKLPNRRSFGFEDNQDSHRDLAKISARMVFREIPELAANISSEVLSVISEPEISGKSQFPSKRTPSFIADTCLPGDSSIDRYWLDESAKASILKFMLPSADDYVKQDLQTRPLRIRTLLFPLLYVSCRENGQDFIMVMNGFSGSVHSNFPRDEYKAVLVRKTLIMIFTGTDLLFCDQILSHVPQTGFFELLMAVLCGGSLCALIPTLLISYFMAPLFRKSAAFCRFMSYVVSTVTTAAGLVIAIRHFDDAPAGIIAAAALSVTVAMTLFRKQTPEIKREPGAGFRSEFRSYRVPKECELKKYR